MVDWLKPLKDFARSCIGGFLPNTMHVAKTTTLPGVLIAEPIVLYSPRKCTLRATGMRFACEWLHEVSAHLLPTLSSTTIATFVLYHGI
jgi:hypothetical protein